MMEYGMKQEEDDTAQKNEEEKCKTKFCYFST